MDRVVRVFRSFEEAEAAEIEEDLAMTPEQRVAAVLELRNRMFPNETQQGLARVCRIAQFERS